MYRNPQAEIFIKTLEETLKDERECQKARQRLQHRERAQRFVQAFWTKLGTDRLMSDRSSPAKQPEPEPAQRVRNE